MEIKTKNFNRNKPIEVNAFIHCAVEFCRDLEWLANDSGKKYSNQGFVDEMLRLIHKKQEEDSYIPPRDIIEADIWVYLCESANMLLGEFFECGDEPYQNTKQWANVMLEDFITYVSYTDGGLGDFFTEAEYEAYCKSKGVRYISADEVED